jgi:hypothetical protein
VPVNEPNEMQDETGDGIAMRIANGDVYIAFTDACRTVAVVLGPEKQEEFAQLYATARRAAAAGEQMIIVPGEVPGA